ncbi:hypothetical protein [Corynebacterium variabile]|uniref:hypothetical protein n=1 Tax=Corynebacterium variabile TaxID=1727 RepID=UPI0028ABE131|nr:hypothetical protein [Corynebacterium variabile]
MANPAELLHDLFVRWNAPNTAPSSGRNDPSLVMHRHAVRYLGEIEELLSVAERNGKRVGSYREYFPLWVKTVFNFPNSWGTPASGAISNEQILHLDNMVDLLNEFVVSPDESKFLDLREYLNLVGKNLAADDSLSPAVRESAGTVITHILGCMDDLTVIGDFEFGKAIERLLGVLATISLRSSQKDRWRKVLDLFVYPYAVGNLPMLSDGAQFFQLMAGSGQ